MKKISPSGCDLPNKPISCVSTRRPLTCTWFLTNLTKACHSLMHLAMFSAMMRLESPTAFVYSFSLTTNCSLVMFEATCLNKSFSVVKLFGYCWPLGKACETPSEALGPGVDAEANAIVSD